MRVDLKASLKATTNVSSDTVGVAMFGSFPLSLSLSPLGERGVVRLRVVIVTVVLRLRSARRNMFRTTDPIMLMY